MPTKLNHGAYVHAPLKRARTMIDELSLRLADEARERQRLQDVCEDSGLVFCLPSLNRYSGE